MLYLHIEDLQKYRKSLPSESTEPPYLDLLIKHLDQAYARVTRKTGAMIEKGQVDYEHIWILFKPGKVAIVGNSGVGEDTQVFMVDYISKDDTGWKIEGHSLRFDGETFGHFVESITIDTFRGCWEIGKLSVYPLHHYWKASIARKLRHRGRQFVGLV
jgi:hypothetical protein